MRLFVTTALLSLLTLHVSAFGQQRGTLVVYSDSDAEIWIDYQKLGDVDANQEKRFTVDAGDRYLQAKALSEDRSAEKSAAVAIPAEGEKVVRITFVDDPGYVYKPKRGSIRSPEMVSIQGGQFYMSNTDESGQEQRVKVTLDGFQISKHEITVQQYWIFCKATNREMPPPPSGGWKDNCPVVNVTWEDARAFCEWAGGRLPTEAEWEFAARGGSQSKGYQYSGANDPEAVGWFINNSDTGNASGGAMQVGQKAPNELGLYDMSGNAWEWCADWLAPYPDTPQTAPEGPENGEKRVLRGGSYRTYSSFWKVSDRHANYPTYSDQNTGFRVVKPLP